MNHKALINFALSAYRKTAATARGRHPRDSSADALFVEVAKPATDTGLRETPSREYLTPPHLERFAPRDPE